MQKASGQLRFFNSGVEVAADGSPVHDNSVHGVPVPHREAIDTTEQPPEVRSSALNDPSLPGIMVAPPGLGFARFGGGVFRCRPHPSGSPNTQKPGNLRDADFQRESRMHQPSFMDRWECCGRSRGWNAGLCVTKAVNRRIHFVKKAYACLLISRQLRITLGQRRRSRYVYGGPAVLLVRYSPKSTKMSPAWFNICSYQSSGPDTCRSGLPNTCPHDLW